MASSSTSNSHIDATGDATEEQHVAWLASIGVSTSGTKDDVIKSEYIQNVPRIG